MLGNLFSVRYAAGKVSLRQMTDGSIPTSRGSADYTVTSGNTYRFRLDVTNSGSPSYIDYLTVTMIEDPDGTPTTTEVLSNINLSNLNYAGGGIGVAAYARPYERRMDNAKLWIDNDADGSWDADGVVFDDDFASAVISPTYDANGNLTFDGVYKYKYDAWNRLVEVRAGEADEPVFATYRYDGTGRRVRKAVTNSGDFDTTEYYDYAGQQMIETRNGTEDATRQFVFGTQYIDELVRMDADTDDDGDCTDSGGSAFYYYHQDANYNVIALTDDTPGPGTGTNGAVAQFYLYDAYGTVHPYAAAAGTPAQELLQPVLEPAAGVQIHNPFTYTGRFLDHETELYYYRGRIYDPRTGRFGQKDPIGVVFPSVPPIPVIAPTRQYRDGLSLYAYAKNNPALYRDSSGLVCGPDGTVFDRVYDDMGFQDCCQAHDHCYGDCDGPPRSVCDDDLFTCMLERCAAGSDSMPWDAQAACAWWILQTYVLVDRLGWIYYRADCDEEECPGQAPPSDDQSCPEGQGWCQCLNDGAGACATEKQCPCW